MSTLAHRVPRFDNVEREQAQQKDEEQRSIWSRCTTLLKDEAEERRESEQTAVLGYN
jgi:hypothetical protein